MPLLARGVMASSRDTYNTTVAIGWALCVMGNLCECMRMYLCTYLSLSLCVCVCECVCVCLYVCVSEVIKMALKKET